MEFIQFKLKQMVGVILNGTVVDLGMIVDSANSNSLLFVKSVHREGELLDEYFFLSGADIFECGSIKKVGTVPNGWRLLIATSSDKPEARTLDPFSPAYELRAGAY